MGARRTELKAEVRDRNRDRARDRDRDRISAHFTFKFSSIETKSTFYLNKMSMGASQVFGESQYQLVPMNQINIFLNHP